MGVASACGAVAAAGALGATTATPLGPEGGSIVSINARPGLVLVTPFDEDIVGDPRATRFAWASTDQGLTWRQATAAERGSFREPTPTDPVRHPSIRRVMYAIGLDRATWTDTFRVSFDGGRTYAVRNRRAFVNINVGALAILATRRPTLLVGVGESSDVSPMGIRRSVDGGRSWRKTTGITGLVYDIWADPVRSNVVYALADPPSGKTRLFRSTTSGRTWTAVGQGLPRMLDTVVPEISISRAHPSVLLRADGNGIYRSIDSGSTWRRVLLEITFSLTHEPTNSAIVYAGTVNGMYRSTDGGRTWHLANSGLLASNVSSIGVAGLPTRIYAAGQFGESTVVSRQAPGVTWENISPSSPSLWGLSIAASHDSPDTVAATTVFGGLTRSTDGGTTWKRSQEFVLRFFANQTSDAIYAQNSDNRLIVSHDVGLTWTTRSLIPEESSITAVGQHLYRWDGVSSSSLSHSANEGASWTRSSLRTAPRLVAAAPSNPAIVYVLLEGSDDRLRRSPDGGATWITVHSSTGVGDLGLTAITVDQTNPNRLYGDGPLGVLMSVDAGRTWRRIAQSPRTGTSIIQDRNTPSRLYIATNAEGVWQIDLG